jgi:hypothetical protein
MICPNCSSVDYQERNPLNRAAAGAATGAAVGSVVPVLGTAAGALFGGLGALILTKGTVHRYVCNKCGRKWGTWN